MRVSWTSYAMFSNSLRNKKIHIKLNVDIIQISCLTLFRNRKRYSLHFTLNGNENEMFRVINTDLEGRLLC